MIRSPSTTFGIGIRDSKTSIQIPPGDEGARWTAAAMLALVHDADEIGDEWTQHVHTMAAHRGGPLPPSEWIRAGAAMFAWFRKNFRFKKDPAGVEYIRTVEQMLSDFEERGHIDGDCDELATFAAAAFRRLEMPAYIVLMGQDAGKPYQHVYAASRSRGGLWLPFDPQETKHPYTERPFAKREALKC